MSSCVNPMSLSKAIICPVKPSTSLALNLTRVSSTYLNQWLGAVPVKVIKALLSTSSICMLWKITSRCQRRQSAFSGLCNTHWRRQTPLHRSVQKTYTDRSVLAVRLSSPTGAQAWGGIRTLNCRAEASPTGKEGKEKEQKPIRGALQIVATQTGHLSKPLKDPEQTERRRREDITTSSFLIYTYIWESHALINIISPFASNLSTHWGRNLSILRTKHPGVSRVMWFLPLSAARTAQISALGRQNNLSINEWHNTRGPTPQAKTGLSTQIWRRNHSFEDNDANILAWEDRWFKRGINYTSSSNGCLWTEEVV